MATEDKPIDVVITWNRSEEKSGTSLPRVSLTGISFFVYKALPKFIGIRIDGGAAPKVSEHFVQPTMKMWIR